MTDSHTRGLYAKYRVERLDGKELGAVFVLEFDDPNCWPALRAYAETVKDEYPQLAADVLLAVQVRETYSWQDLHVGRSFKGIYRMEESCPCPQLPCGLVDMGKAIEIDCPEHSPIHAKTIRTTHQANQCPGAHVE